MSYYMNICYPSGSITELPINFLETMPLRFHPPLTQYTNTALSVYVDNLKAAINVVAEEFELLKNACEDSSWLIAVDACKCHLQLREIDEFDTSITHLDCMADEHEAMMDDDTYDMIKMYIEEWDSNVQIYRYCVELIKYLEYAVYERCIAQIYFRK